MKCGQKCEVYSRVVGYHNPVQHWNKGKQEEFADRLEFQEEHSINSKVLHSKYEDKNISKYLLFTFPNCEKCEDVKDYLEKISISSDIINLKDPKGYKRFQNYYKELREKLKRNEDNSVVLPVMLEVDDNNHIKQVAQSLDDVKSLAS